MSNVLHDQKKAVIIASLCEGCSIRSIERMTGVHRDTIMRLGVRVGEACQVLHDESMRELPCTHIEADEIWGFIGKKQRLATLDEQETGLGDVWTFVAFDPDSKLVPSFCAGKRDYQHTTQFIGDLASRMRDRIQISTDGMNEYMSVINETFGADVDYAQIIKTYGSPDIPDQRRYSPPTVISMFKKRISGEPNMNEASTSLVERQNLTMRMHMRRLTRLTNAFSKKLENFKAAVALHFAYYNFVRLHSTIRSTPAMAAGVTNRLWRVEDLVHLA